MCLQISCQFPCFLIIAKCVRKTANTWQNKDKILQNKRAVSSYLYSYYFLKCLSLSEVPSKSQRSPLLSLKQSINTANWIFVPSLNHVLPWKPKKRSKPNGSKWNLYRAKWIFAAADSKQGQKKKSAKCKSPFSGHIWGLEADVFWQILQLTWRVNTCLSNGAPLWTCYCTVIYHYNLSVTSYSWKLQNSIVKKLRLISVILKCRIFFTLWGQIQWCRDFNICFVILSQHTEKPVIMSLQWKGENPKPAVIF